MASGRNSSNPSTDLPGLLPWQVCFLTFFLGVSTVRYSLAAVVSVLCLWLIDHLLRFGLKVRKIWCGCLFVVFLAGYGVGSILVPPPAPPAPKWMMQRTPVMVSGVVEQVLPKSENRLKIVLDNVVCFLSADDSRPLEGKIVWTWQYPDNKPDPGQLVQVRLRLRPVRGFRNAGTWDYAWYWRLRGVYWQGWSRGMRYLPQWGSPPNTFSWDLRRHVCQLVRNAVSSTQGGALVYALLTGDRSLLDVNTVRIMRSAGLSHTLALSGLHVGFMVFIGVGLAFICGWLCPKIYLHVPRPRLAVLFAAPLVIFYVWVGQPSSSLLRAGIMFLFWGVLLLAGRGRVLLDGLFAALAVLVALDPLSVFDLSLRMSGIAVGGIAVLLPLFKRFFPSGPGMMRRLCRWAGSLLAISISANIALLPLLSWNFGLLAANPVLNLVWIPLLGALVMPLGVLGVISSFLFGWSQPLWAASLVANQMLVMLHGVSGLGFAPTFAVLRPLWPEILGFVVLMVGVLVANRKIAKDFLPVLALAGFLLLIGPHWFVCGKDALGGVSLTLLDVGQGQAALVSLPGGKRYLVDGGGTASHTFDIGEAVVGPALAWGHPPHLDGVFLSHSDYDHSQGLCHILDFFDVTKLYANSPLPTGEVGERMTRAITHNGLVPHTLFAGDRVQLGEGFSFVCFNPIEGLQHVSSNNRSQVVRLERNGHGVALLCGDVEAAALKRLVKQNARLESDVLVVPHHGSKGSFDQGFYARVGARFAICSCGYLNRYGFPAQRVVQGLADCGTKVLTTSEYGMISVNWPETAFSETIVPQICGQGDICF